LSIDCWFVDLIQTYQEYAGFVDANGLCFLWPEEFNQFRFLFISGTPTAPIFSSFSRSEATSEDLIEVIVHCNGSHFTLLRPHPSMIAMYRPRNAMPSKRGFKVIDHIITDAKATGRVIQENIVNPPAGLPSINQVIQAVYAV
jgi:hypothetical protein